MTNELEKRVERLELAAEAQRLIGLYANYMEQKEYGKIVDLFALGMPNLCAEMLWGCYDGDEGIRRLYLDLMPALTQENSGAVAAWAQTMEVPVIQPAKDRQTVKAVWVSPGYTAVWENGGVTGYWSWQKYACDFIRTDNGLKIWHLHVYGLFEGLYDTADVQSSGKMFEGNAAIREFPPDRGPTTEFILSEDSIYPYTPAIPKPYYVFDQDDRY